MNDELNNPAQPSPATPEQPAAYSPVTDVQPGVSVFPSRIELASQPLTESNNSPAASQQSYLADQPIADPVSVPVTADQVQSNHENTTPQAHSNLPSNGATSTIDPTLEVAVSQAVAPTVPEPKPKSKSVKQWVALGVFSVIAMGVISYFYLTTNETLESTGSAANSYSAGVRQPYEGAYIESGKEAYKVYVPNGSDVVVDPLGNMIFFQAIGEGGGEPIKLGYIDGVGGGDRPALSIRSYKMNDTVSIDGVKPTTPFYADGVQAKYYHKSYLPDEIIDNGVKAEGGEKVYRYVFSYDDQHIVVDYFIKRKDEDRSEMVGKMASTFKFKRAESKPVQLRATQP